MLRYPSFFNNSTNSFLIFGTSPMPLYTSEEYTSTTLAPALIFSYASAPLAMPPTPMIGTWPFVNRYISRMVSVLFSRKGSPLSPPFCVLNSLLREAGRETVVLLITIPSTLYSNTNRAICCVCQGPLHAQLLQIERISRSSGSRSGDNFTRRGGCCGCFSSSSLI